MTYTEKYIAEATRLLSEVLKRDAEPIKLAAEKAFETSLAGGRLFYYGSSHAGILAQEAFYRTGGLVTANPVLPKGLGLDTVPVTDTTSLERDPAFAHEILDRFGIKKGDWLLIHSVSGRNGVCVELATEAKKRGIFTVGVTSVTASSASASRHPSGKKLFELCDILIDNPGCVGDAAIPIEGFHGKTGATSTVTGAAIINSITAEVIGLYVENGLEPPVFMSANVDGGDEYNRKMMEKYKDKITYMGE